MVTRLLKYENATRWMKHKGLWKESKWGERTKSAGRLTTMDCKWTEEQGQSIQQSFQASTWITIHIQLNEQ